MFINKISQLNAKRKHALNISRNDIKLPLKAHKLNKIHVVETVSADY